MLDNKMAASDGRRNTASKANPRAVIVADNTLPGNSPSFGRCACRAPIGSNVRTLGCPTCGAWQRWLFAVRTAVRALRGPQ